MQVMEAFGIFLHVEYYLRFPYAFWGAQVGAAMKSTNYKTKFPDTQVTSRGRRGRHGWRRGVPGVLNYAGLRRGLARRVAELGFWRGGRPAAGRHLALNVSRGM